MPTSLLSPLCMTKCKFKCSFRLNPFMHTLQMYGRSGEWPSLWRSKCSFRFSPAPQMSQMYRRSILCTDKCCSKLLLSGYAIWHSGQQNNIVPSMAVAMCTWPGFGGFGFGGFFLYFRFFFTLPFWSISVVAVVAVVVPAAADAAVVTVVFVVPFIAVNGGGWLTPPLFDVITMEPAGWVSCEFSEPSWPFIGGELSTCTSRFMFSGLNFRNCCKFNGIPWREKYSAKSAVLAAVIALPHTGSCLMVTAALFISLSDKYNFII